MSDEKAYHDEQWALYRERILKLLKNYRPDLRQTTGAIPGTQLPLGGPSGTGYPPSPHTTNWADVVGTPTTLAGYGITDAASSSALASEAGARSAADTALAAPEYLTLALSGTLANERRLIAGSGISITDGGANGDATISATGGSGAGAWINVKDYGATGNGSTDDTSAINSAIAALISAGRGVLYFPAGDYKVTSALTALSVPTFVLGDGEAGANTGAATYYGTRIRCTSATAALFTVTASMATIERLALENTAGSTPSAGAGIVVASGSDANQRVNIANLTARRFWIDIDVQVGTAWTMRNCIIGDAVKYGVKVQNTLSADAGDWAISDSVFASALACDASLRLESSGGGKIVNCKFNGGGSGSRPVRHIDMAVSGTTSILLVANCSFENYGGDALHLVGPNWNMILLANCQFGQYANGSGHAISVDTLSDVLIASCHFRADTGTPTAISLSTVTRYWIGPQTNNGFSTLLSTSSSSGVDASSGAGGAAAGDLSGTYPAPTVANDAITYAKMQNVSATSRLLGRASSGAGDVEELTIGTGLALSGTTISATGGGTWSVLTNGDTTTPELIFAGGDVVMVYTP